MTRVAFKEKPCVRSATDSLVNTGPPRLQMPARAREPHDPFVADIGRAKAPACKLINPRPDVRRRGLIGTGVVRTRKGVQVPVRAMAFGNEKPVQRRLGPLGLQPAGKPAEGLGEHLFAPVPMVDDCVAREHRHALGAVPECHQRQRRETSQLAGFAQLDYVVLALQILAKPRKGRCVVVGLVETIHPLYLGGFQLSSRRDDCFEACHAASGIERKENTP